MSYTDKRLKILLQTIENLYKATPKKMDKKLNFIQEVENAAYKNYNKTDIQLADLPF